jgi:hypothetical protein
MLDAVDIEMVERQLGRPPRDLLDVAHRCPCGNPDVVTTAPRLDDGTPFPTYYYLTCPTACSAIGSLEASGLMAEMAARLSTDDDLSERYRRAHRAYLADRERHGTVDEIADTSAGGMPGRVKCLHALAAHSLVAGPGLNPFGDETIERLGAWWQDGPCVPPAEPSP